MKITIFTIFPKMFDGLLTNSIIKRAIAKKVVDIKIVNIRDYTLDKYHRVDSAPISGGAGLIMKCQPIVDALKKNAKNSYIILTSARGNKYDENKAKALAKLDDISIVCGHYEGIDERVNKYVDELISIGDYILTGGEIAAMAMVDSIVRLLKGAISIDSLTDESFNDGALEYPQYTEPYDFNGMKVPEILYSGNHTAIKKFNRKEQLRITKKYRPDLFNKLTLSKLDKALLKEIENNEIGNWEKEALKKE